MSDDKQKKVNTPQINLPEPPKNLQSLKKFKGESSINSNNEDPANEEALAWNNGKLSGDGSEEDPFIFQDKFGVNYEWDPETESWHVKQTSTLQTALLISEQQSIYKYKADEDEQQKKLNDEAEKKKRRDANLEAKKRAEQLELKSEQELTSEEREILEKRKKRHEKQAIKKVKKTFERGIDVTGLPPGITDKKVQEFFESKGGYIELDINNKPYIFFDYDEHHKMIGSAQIIFHKPESIPLVETLLDGVEIEKGFPVTIKKAQYRLSKEGAIEFFQKYLNLSPQELKKKRKRDLNKHLNWENNEECRVVLKNVFSLDPPPPEDFFAELEEDLKEEAETFGPLERIKIFERNPQGIVVLKFKSFFVAERCVEKMNGRYFDQRKLEAELYDGHSDFDSRETVEEQQERLSKWRKYLEEEEDESE